ncbi:LysR family transcriptional regulator [Luteipulveratus sp. YIM 133132]|uniref:LysR family transcriptional regulator n=1 Tax=Luteipulveratus flavus TaxID=3031728 RepID=UPI0023B204FE|nr:LysR family transcriptional regulator [Luteipulveratus sp. YIM 133132]MDE9365772.1 LysR family transcriptional regulator [Luteipulveratus sp. YIM 133132]
MEIELRHLKLVQAVGELGSVSKAAAALSTTQPAATRQLRRIEDSLGSPLFERSAEGMTPTPVGEMVMARAHTVLTAVETLCADAEQSTGSAPSIVTVGARTGTPLIAMAEYLDRALPATRVVLESETRMQTLVDMVGAGLLHAAAVSEFVGWEVDLPAGVDKQTVGVEPVFVVMAPDHPLAQHEEIQVSDLADARWVLQPTDLDREPDVFAQACARAGIRPTVEHTLRGAAALAFIREGGRLGLCYPTARFDGLVTRPIRRCPVRVRHLMLTAQRGPLQGYGERLARSVRERMAAEVQMAPAYDAWLERERPLTSVS